MNGDRPAHVVVVGGGFAGVACARRLAGQPGVHVTLLERTGYHQFQPLLYQVATAELTPDDIRFDLEEMFAKHDNVEVRTAEAVAADPSAPSVTLAGGEVVAGDLLPAPSRSWWTRARSPSWSSGPGPPGSRPPGPWPSWSTT
jgi:NADH dehydrogenase FAD-containing subunit